MTNSNTIPNCYKLTCRAKKCATTRTGMCLVSTEILAYSVHAWVRVAFAPRARVYERSRHTVCYLFTCPASGGTWRTRIAQRARMARESGVWRLA